LSRNEIGLLAWMWAGYFGGNECLYLTSDNTFPRNDLTDWGKDVFYEKNGIRNTYKKAYDK
jgi:hypothetical protein